MKTVAFGSQPGAIERARRSDLARIRRLLNANGLPSADISESSLEHFLVVREAMGIVAVVGIERHGEAALLRSLVVADGYGGRGLGRRLVTAAEVLVAELDLRGMFLLTTSADLYFAALGFRYLKREEAPHTITQSSQFKSLCPATAVLMVKP